jgi:hypothetical protein
MMARGMAAAVRAADDLFLIHLENLYFYEN